jgi:neurotransmitter:Na+ symporter, NSS family
MAWKQGECRFVEEKVFPVSNPHQKKTAMSHPKQESWGSRLGVIMAVAGSAVGLGNFLRFPGLAAQYGGGAFMVAYAISFLIIGLPIGWAEWTMGRYAGSRGFHSAPGAFAVILQRPWGKYLGVCAVIIPVVIYMYYVVIESWCIGYAVNFFRGEMRFGSAGEAIDYFEHFVGIRQDAGALAWSWDRTLPWLLGVFVFNFWLIYRGLSGGIEKMCNIGMPLLIVLACVVLGRVLTLGAPDPQLPEQTVNQGLGYLWNPGKVELVKTNATAADEPQRILGEAALAKAEKAVAASQGALVIRHTSVWTQLRNPRLWLAAASQIFFSLSVGFGVIIVYASYMRREDDVVLSGLTASSANEFCEVALGGLITVPAAVAFLGIAGLAGQASTLALGFKVLPLVFSKMPLGHVFGGLFFSMLFLAAITSSISMLQPGIAFLEEALRIGRKASVTLLSLITCFGAALVVYFSAGLKALDTLDFWAGNFLIFSLATAQILIFSWHWGTGYGLQEMRRGAAIGLPPGLGLVMRWLCPAFLMTIFTLWFLQDVVGLDLVEWKKGPVSAYVTDLIGTKTSLPARLSVLFVFVLMIFFSLITGLSRSYRRAESDRSSS